MGIYYLDVIGELVTPNAISGVGHDILPPFGGDNYHIVAPNNRDYAFLVTMLIQPWSGGTTGNFVEWDVYWDGSDGSESGADGAGGKIPSGFLPASVSVVHAAIPDDAGTVTWQLLCQNSAADYAYIGSGLVTAYTDADALRFFPKLGGGQPSGVIPSDLIGGGNGQFQPIDFSVVQLPNGMLGVGGSERGNGTCACFRRIRLGF